MSEENVEILERLVEAWNARDIDALRLLTHPDAEYVNEPSALEPGTRHGHEGMEVVVRKQWEGLGSDARQDVDEVHEVGDDLITAGRISMSMPGSSSRLEVPAAFRWSFRDGRVERCEVLGIGPRFKPALEAAGLG